MVQSVQLFKIINNFKSCYYFPSYEIMIDELRDYRYYKSDMLHPTSQAIDYVWLKFKTYAINSKSNNLIDKVFRIKKSVLHRPLNVNNIHYKSHVIKTLESIELIKSSTPFTHGKRRYSH